MTLFLIAGIAWLVLLVGCWFALGRGLARSESAAVVVGAEGPQRPRERVARAGDHTPARPPAGKRSGAQRSV